MSWLKSSYAIYKSLFPKSLSLVTFLTHWVRFPTAFSDVADLNIGFQTQEHNVLPVLQYLHEMQIYWPKVLYQWLILLKKICQRVPNLSKINHSHRYCVSLTTLINRFLSKEAVRRFVVNQWLVMLWGKQSFLCTAWGKIMFYCRI